ncbi:hypothetical protein [Burkholderia ubonensis]|uniref:hypothetical protein n=1 Tax=Burkholderia ubonensis TaxID=101571 RepID=UPI0012F874E7|nr:hypothetical protein [Burkholderia ubonensis]
MTNFISALKQGLDQAKIAEKNRAEINEVFSELNKQLGAVSKKRLSIVPLQASGIPSGSLLQALVTKRSDWSLYARFDNDGKVSTHQIAAWIQSPSGYPCRVDFSSTSYSCEDKSALENVLKLLLSDPTVGEILQKYVNFQEDGEGSQVDPAE